MLGNHVMVNSHTLEGEMLLNTVKLLHYKIEYPQFISLVHDQNLKIINDYYRNRALEKQWTYENQLYLQAFQQYEESIVNQFPFHAYEAFFTHDVTYNKDCVISLYSDEYVFSGGAHGSTIRRSETWNIQEGQQASILFLVENLDYMIDMINQQIAAQISLGENWYFDNYKQLVSENFNTESFYLINDGLIIYYQQYDIAPYSSGIMEFFFPWSDKVEQPKWCAC